MAVARTGHRCLDMRKLVKPENTAKPIKPAQDRTYVRSSPYQNKVSNRVTCCLVLMNSVQQYPISCLQRFCAHVCTVTYGYVRVHLNTFYNDLTSAATFLLLYRVVFACHQQNPNMAGARSCGRIEFKSVISELMIYYCEWYNRKI